MASTGDGGDGIRRLQALTYRAWTASLVTGARGGGQGEGEAGTLTTGFRPGAGAGETWPAGTRKPGMTAFDAGEADPAPAALLALTVKV